MCAIAGVIGLNVSKEGLAAMLATMRRRGPDGQGIWQKEDNALLHSRLAVIDPQGGKQPMTLEFGNETYVITYNGELYNASELKAELIKLGHHFLGHSDTEVLLHAYAQWGRGCLDRLNGIYAFGVWEETGKRLFLARDRMGVKPLFFMRKGKGLLFASEIKSILAFPGIRPQLDAHGAAQILLLGPGRTPGCGVFRDMEELEPGCCAYFEQGILSVSRYWTLTDREHTDSFGDTVYTVRSLVTDAIRRQMVSDVPIGAFLSGGLDSSIICAVMANEFANEGKQLHTFSIDYADNDRYFVPDKFQPNSDGYYIRKMQSFLDSRHHWTVLTPQQLEEALEEAVIARDLPGMADVDISLLQFCREIRCHVTVALSGECADEIFGGYPWYRDPQIRDRAGFPWAQNTQLRLSLAAPKLRNTIGEDFVQAQYEKTCGESVVLPGCPPEERRMKEMVNLNQRWFMQTLLDRKDRMSMYSALEVRVPFCDHRIAEYLYGVPWAFKDYMGKEKGLLRHAMEGILPEEVLWRKKSPYPKTWHPLYLQLMCGRLEALLRDKEAPIHALIDPKAAETLLTQDQPWPWYGQLMKRPQTICYLLQTDFWLRHYGVELLF